MLLPTSCPVCGALGPAPCSSCARALAPAPALPRPPGVDSCASAFAYAGAGRELVARVKYRNARAAVPWLAGRMAAAFGAAEVDAVTWAPTSAVRRRQRGFDQARLLARAVARRVGVPCRALLRRRPGPAQTGRSRAERREGPSFAARGPVPARVLLVDDVVTTGGTVAAAARALRQAGATEVHVLVAARTPAPGASGADVHFGGQARQEGVRWTSPSSAATPRSPSLCGPRHARRSSA
ncbi:MAG TPA: phosphoribosyltransferase family protein [Acidimicrobiales bacterium]|nr:phosphoribosyltransferase family protein [Acidimicrobiales bacterium]